MLLYKFILGRKLECNTGKLKWSVKFGSWIEMEMNTHSVWRHITRINYDKETIIILTVDKIFPSVPPTKKIMKHRVTWNLLWYYCKTQNVLPRNWQVELSWTTKTGTPLLDTTFYKIEKINYWDKCIYVSTLSVYCIKGWSHRCFWLQEGVSLFLKITSDYKSNLTLVNRNKITILMMHLWYTN